MEPIGDRLPYDLVIERGGRFLRLQIKTGSVDFLNDYYSVGIPFSKTKEIDFFIFVIYFSKKTNIFYIVPAKDIEKIGIKRGLIFIPHRERKTTRKGNIIEKYKNSWEVLDERL